MTLDVDGKKTEEPDSAAIAREFESIDKRTGFRGGGISLVILSRGEGESLTASGHPSEGWPGLIQEDAGVSSSANPSSPLSQEKIIQIFQSYARGEELWKKEFEWEGLEKPVWFRVVALVGILLVILFFVRKFGK